MPRLGWVLLVAAAAPVWAGTQQVPADWISPAEARYALLERIAAAVEPEHWLLESMRRKERLPQASARILAFRLAQAPGLGEGERRELLAAFPSEVEEAQAERPVSKLGGLKQEMAELERGMRALEAARASNTYYKGSLPSANIGMGAFGQGYAYSGFATRQQADQGARLWVDLSGSPESGAFGIHLAFRYEPLQPGRTAWNSNGTSGLMMDSGSSAQWTFDSPLGGLQLGLGGQQLGFSHFILSSLGFPDPNSFFEGGALPALDYGPKLGYHDAVGLLLRRQGRLSWFWPFHDARLFLGPGRSYFDSYDLRKINQAAFRGSLWNLQGLWLENLVPYISASTHATDQAQLAGFSPAIQAQALPEQSRSYALGLSGQVPGGGTFSAEWAHSHWQRQGGPAFEDQAWWVNGIKSFGRLQAGLEGAQVGPHFIAGTRRGRISDHGQNGAFLDTSVEDDRPGRSGTAWETLSWLPQWMVNNSRRVLAQLSWVEDWGSFSIQEGHSLQMNPSGPWLEAAFWSGNNPFNGFDRFRLFGENYWVPGLGQPLPPDFQSPALYFYNQAAERNFITPDGPYLERWNAMYQTGYRTTAEAFMLTQAGVGDLNLRRDSIKYFNTLRLSWLMDFKAAFNLSLPLSLQVSDETRDTGESAYFPGTGPTLLLQRVDELNLVWGWNPELNFLALLGYETWQSRSMHFPVDYIERQAGLGWDFLLNRLLTGLNFKLRARWLEHLDLNLMSRSFSGWTLGASSTVYY